LDARQIDAVARCLGHQSFGGFSKRRDEIKIKLFVIEATSAAHFPIEEVERIYLPDLSLLRYSFAVKHRIAADALT